MYSLGSGDEPDLLSRVLDGRKLDLSVEKLKHVARLADNLTGGAVVPVVSEAGGAYNSGQRGFSDTFASAFWYNDLLGALAKHGHAMGCRQSLLPTHFLGTS